MPTQRAIDIGRIGWRAGREPRITTPAAFRTQPSLAAAYPGWPELHQFANLRLPTAVPMVCRLSAGRNRIRTSGPAHIRAEKSSQSWDIKGDFPSARDQIVIFIAARWVRSLPRRASANRARRRHLAFRDVPLELQLPSAVASSCYFGRGATCQPASAIASWTAIHSLVSPPSLSLASRPSSSF